MPVAALVTLAVRRPDRRVVGVCLALVALPAAYTFGTNTNLWSGAARATTLWVAALALAAAAPGRTARARAWPPASRLPAGWLPAGWLPAVWPAAASALVAGVVIAAADSYYRYPTPGPDMVSGEIDAAGHRLRLTPQDARDSSVLAAAARSGAPGAPGAGRDILDTTGASPGYIWQLGGRAVGSDWLLGGYPGSEAAARHALSLVPCERLVDALVLAAPDSPRRIDGLWTTLGVDPARDYRPVLRVRHQLG